MKKFTCLALALAMMAGTLTACGGSEAKTDAPAADDKAAATETIKIGTLGPHTGEYAVYGLAVKNGAELYINQLNEAGGINGKQIEYIAYDNKGDNAEAISLFTREVDEGISGLIGDVLTGNTIAVVGEAAPINMPMVTASATAAEVTYDAESDTLYSNVFRTCFIDPFQGEKMAQYAVEKLEAKTAAVFYETGSDYSVGLSDAFQAKAAELGLEVVAVEGFATGDKDFRAQMTNIAATNADVVFCPAYYENDGLIVTQAREVGVNGIFMGGDGWSGVKDYADAAALEGSVYCSAYAPGSSEDVIAFEEAYIAAYGDENLNMFAANAYDAAMVMCNALAIVDEAGLEVNSDEYKQAVIDAIRDESGDLKGVTSDGYSFDAYNNPIKNAVIMELKGGEETFKEIF